MVISEGVALTPLAVRIRWKRMCPWQQFAYAKAVVASCWESSNWKWWNVKLWPRHLDLCLTQQRKFGLLCRKDYFGGSIIVMFITNWVKILVNTVFWWNYTVYMNVVRWHRMDSIWWNCLKKRQGGVVSRPFYLGILGVWFKLQINIDLWVNLQSQLFCNKCWKFTSWFFFTRLHHNDLLCLRGLKGLCHS